MLLQDGTGLGVGDTLAPEADGTFVIELVVPADVAPGSTLTVPVDCGFDGQTVQSISLTVTVTDVAPATETTEADTTPAAVTAHSSLHWLIRGRWRRDAGCD